MSLNQAVFSLAALMVTLVTLFAGFFKYYLDAKVDPMAKQINLLVQYMIEHQGKIAKLEERTK